MTVALITNLFMFSTDPWSCGWRARPVTARMFGFIILRNSRTTLAVGSELLGLSIVSMKDPWIAQHSKYILKLVGNTVGPLPWEHNEIVQSNRMVL
jgi:hypothetical protein